MKRFLTSLLLLLVPALANVLPTLGESMFMPFLLFNIVVEIGVFYFLYKKKAVIKTYLSLIGANILSYLIIGFLFFEAIVYGGGELSMWLLEIPIILFEGGVLHHFNKKAFPLKEAMMASLKMNMATIVIGFLMVLLMMLSYTPALPPM
ncbi:hypothetical protein ACFLQ2_03300 [archaeon]